MVFATDQPCSWRRARVLTQDGFVAPLYPTHCPFPSNVACQTSMSDYFFHIREFDRVQSTDEYVLLSSVDMFTRQSEL
jgi:hypothetical protein